MEWPPPLIIRHLSWLNSMLNYKYILLCWIPDYIGMKGNEKTDLASNSSLDLVPDKFEITYNELKQIINRFLPTKWQQSWNNNIHAKHFGTTDIRKVRKEQVAIYWLRIGHTRHTHSFFRQHEQQQLQCLTSPVGWGCRIHRLLLCREVRLFFNKCPGYDTKRSDG